MPQTVVKNAFQTKAPTAVFQVDLPDGTVFETEAPEETTQATIQALAKDWFAKQGTADIRAKQAQLGKSPGLVDTALKFGGSLVNSAKNTISGANDLATGLLTKPIDTTLGFVQGLSDETNKHGKAAIAGLKKTVGGVLAGLNPNLMQRTDGVPIDRYSSFVDALEGSADTLAHTTGLIPLLGPAIAQAYERSKVDPAGGAGEWTFLAAPLFAKGAVQMYKNRTPKVPPPSPRTVIKGEIDNLVSEIGQFTGSTDDLGAMIAQRTTAYRSRAFEIADSLEQEALEAAKRHAPPVKQQTVVTARLEEGLGRPMASERKVPKLGPDGKPLFTGKGKVKQPVLKTKVTIHQPAIHDGELLSFEDKLPPPRPISLNIQDASAGLADEIAAVQAGPPGSAATSKLYPKGVVQEGGFGLTEPLVETAEHTLKRVGDTASLDKLKAARNIRKDIAENADIQLIEQHLATDPATAYRQLYSPELSAAQRANIAEIVGPETWQAMQSQMVQDFLNQTYRLGTALEEGIPGIRAGGSSMVKVLSAPTGQALLKTLKPEHARSLEEIARIASNTKLEPATIVSSLSKYLDRPSVKNAMIRHAIAGVTGWQTGSWLAAGAVEVGLETTMALMSRIMSKTEGMNNIKEFSRALGRNDLKRINSFGIRIQQQIERELRRSIVPAGMQEDRTKKNLVLPPPPG